MAQLYDSRPAASRAELAALPKLAVQPAAVGFSSRDIGTVAESTRRRASPGRDSPPSARGRATATVGGERVNQTIEENEAASLTCESGVSPLRPH